MLMENLPIPQDLQAEFESVATLMYGEEDAPRALTEAVELWLANHRKQVIESEHEANRQTYLQIKSELAEKYPGKWFAIAHGKLQGVADTIEALNEVAMDAHHRIVMQVGEPAFIQPVREIELGWQISHG